MKIEVGSEGELVLKEVFSGVVLQTEEGNKLTICMRDDTFELKVNDGPWQRVDPKTSVIRP